MLKSMPRFSYFKTAFLIEHNLSKYVT
uniref:Uncharacterized protein n=1 Tax=Arundo donax TaxID=35708 RepID=A0A0A9GVS8_ARUDO